LKIIEMVIQLLTNAMIKMNSKREDEEIRGRKEK
jgi:hypothetical protein